MEQYQIYISFGKFTAKYGKAHKDKDETRKIANRLLETIQPQKDFSISVSIEKQTTN